MKLWELRPAPDFEIADGPWDALGDKIFGLIVRAETEPAARMLAGEKHGDPIWLDEERTTCVELTADADAGVVMIDLNAE